MFTHTFSRQKKQSINQSIHFKITSFHPLTEHFLDDSKVMEKGFAAISFNKLRGTVAAGDGIIIRMQRPTVFCEWVK